MSPQLEPLVTLMRRYPWCVACIVVTLLCGGAIGYLYFVDIPDLAAPYEQSAKDYGDMLALTKSGRTTREELEAARAITRRIEANLLIEVDLADNNLYFYKFVERTKARLADINQLNSPPSDNTPLFRRVPWTLRVSGTYEQVAAFILAIEAGPRLTKITSFTMTRQNAASKEGGRAASEAPLDPTATVSVVADLALEVLGKK